MPLSLPKRLAMNILNCGKRKVWIDPTKINEMKKVRTSIKISKRFFFSHFFKKFQNK